MKLRRGRGDGEIGGKGLGRRRRLVEPLAAQTDRNPGDFGAVLARGLDGIKKFT